MTSLKRTYQVFSDILSLSVCRWFVCVCCCAVKQLTICHCYIMLITINCCFRSTFGIQSTFYRKKSFKILKMWCKTRNMYSHVNLFVEHCFHLGKYLSSINCPLFKTFKLFNVRLNAFNTCYKRTFILLPIESTDTNMTIEIAVCALTPIVLFAILYLICTSYVFHVCPV